MNILIHQFNLYCQFGSGFVLILINSLTDLFIYIDKTKVRVKV